MTSLPKTRSRNILVHWVVLWSLLLGQLALGIGYGLAAQGSNDEIKVPVCTSNGIEYVSWKIKRGSSEFSENGVTAKSGGCVLCTVAPAYFDFGSLHTPIKTELTVEFISANWFIPNTPQFILYTAAPRAPPAA